MIGGSKTGSRETKSSSFSELRLQSQRCDQSLCLRPWVKIGEQAAGVSPAAPRGTVREPLNSDRSHQANADAIQFPWDAEMVSPHSYASSRFQLGVKVGRLTQPLCSSRITGLHRSYGLVRPRTCHRYSRLMAFATCTSPPSHPSPGSRSSAQEPGPGSRPLYAGCRAPSNQVSGALIPEVWPPLVLAALIIIGASACARLPGPYLPADCISRLCPQRSPPRLLTAAAWSGLLKGLPSSLTQARSSQLLIPKPPHSCATAHTYVFTYTIFAKQNLHLAPAH